MYPGWFEKQQEIENGKKKCPGCGGYANYRATVGSWSCKPCKLVWNHQLGKFKQYGDPAFD